MLAYLPGLTAVRLPVLDLTLFWGGGGGGSGDPNFFLDISSSWIERSLHAKFQLSRLPRSGSSRVGDKNNKNQVNLQWCHIPFFIYFLGFLTFMFFRSSASFLGMLPFFQVVILVFQKKLGRLPCLGCLPFFYFFFEVIFNIFFRSSFELGQNKVAYQKSASQVAWKCLKSSCGGGWVPTHYKVKLQLMLRLSWVVTKIGRIRGFLRPAEAKVSQQVNGKLV